MKLILKCKNKGLGPKNCLFVFEVPVQSQENEQSCICVLGILILPLSKICYWILELFQQYDIFLVFSEAIQERSQK